MKRISDPKAVVESSCGLLDVFNSDSHTLSPLLPAQPPAGLWQPTVEAESRYLGSPKPLLLPLESAGIPAQSSVSEAVLQAAAESRCAQAL